MTISGLYDIWQKLKYFGWFMAHEYLFDLAWFVGPVLICLRADFKVEGPGQIPKKGPVIITSNHLSMWDLVVIYNILPRSFNTMAKVELFEVFFIGGLIRLMGAFPVNRNKADRQALNHSISLLKQGKLLGIFPEGHRSDHYALMKAHNGAALIAVQSNATIVPVAIWGTELISRKTDWKKNLPGPFFRRRPHVTVKVGASYNFSDAVSGTKPDLEEVTNMMMGKIAELLPSEYQGEYSKEKLAERKNRGRKSLESAEKQTAKIKGLV